MNYWKKWIKMSKKSFEHSFENPSLEQQRPFILYQRDFKSEASEALGNPKKTNVDKPAQWAILLLDKPMLKQQGITILRERI